MYGLRALASSDRAGMTLHPVGHLGGITCRLPSSVVTAPLPCLSRSARLGWHGTLLRWTGEAEVGTKRQPARCKGCRHSLHCNFLGFPVQQHGGVVHHVEAEARLEVVRLEVAQDRFSSVSILASTAVNFRVLEPDRHLEAVVHEDVSANTSAADKPGSTSSDPSWEAAVCRAGQCWPERVQCNFSGPFGFGRLRFW